MDFGAIPPLRHAVLRKDGAFAFETWIRSTLPTLVTSCEENSFRSGPGLSFH